MPSVTGSQRLAAAVLLAAAMMVCACSNGKGAYSDDSAEQASTNAKPAPHTTGAPASTWNPASAAAYLDQREAWWLQWKDAKRDNNTFCVSCHTNLPFVFAQSVLRGLPADAQTSAAENKIIEDVTKRVRLWNSVESYYGEKDDASGNGPGSRSTEAVLSAVILAFHDSQTGELTDDTRLAFKNMWALQQTSGSQEGAWLWQKFRLSPWESSASPYFGATLAALAVGVAPGNYRSTPEIQNNLTELRGYLERGYSDESLLNRAGLLWASTKWPGLLSAEQQKSIVKEIYEKQRSDGGWSLSSITWSSHYFGIPSLLTTRRRNDWTPQETKSDGLATGYLTFVLEQAGVPRDNPQLKNAIAWLVRNQNQAEGYWTAYSLNQKLDPSSNVGRFMTDAATAFAVLALSEKGS